MNARPVLFTRLCLLLIVAITCSVYAHVYSAQFISWDDPELLLHNADVHTFNISAFFSGSYQGNYMPLTMLLYGFEWKFFGDAPLGYHCCNLLLHCLNGILVFLLSYKILKNNYKALLCTLVFCLHPLQTEAVAWVAETKTLLFTFFFLCALLRYHSYCSPGKPLVLYVQVLALFVLSILSKPAAICLPLCLLCLDLISGRQLHKKILFEKLPFFIVALFFGLLTVHTQQQDKFINPDHAFNWLVRAGYAGYALLSYVGSFLFPVGLSVIYPYPQNHFAALLCGFLFIAILAILLYILYKKKQAVLIGMILFSLCNLLLVLQFIPFGEVLTADRYMYLPVLGFSWILFYRLHFSTAVFKITGITLLIVLGILTFSRSNVWQNSLSLYSDILEKYPNSAEAMNSLGAVYMLQGDDQLAYNYLNKAVSGSPVYYKAYYNLGLLEAKNNKFREAIDDFTKVIKARHYDKALLARANAYYQIGAYQPAIADAEQSSKIKSLRYESDQVLGDCYENLDQLEPAIHYYSELITGSPADPALYLHRAMLYGKQKNFSACITDLDNCLRLDAKNAEAYYWKGVAKVNLQQDACAEFDAAYRLGLQQAASARAKYCH